jgi:hypothetical protein
MAKSKKTIKKYYRKSRWSANIRNIGHPISAPIASTFYSHLSLCENPIQTDNTVSQQYTVKNIELSIMIESSENDLAQIESLVTYIMYVPQGYVITETLPNNHPEWIMAYRYLGSPKLDANAYVNPLKIKTRMARRLQTGDKIIFLLVGDNQKTTGSPVGLGVHGMVRWWTKAN